MAARDSLLAAPIVTSTGSRMVNIPPGQWLDVEHHRVITGPATLKRYQASLAQTPVFIRLGTTQTRMLTRAFASVHNGRIPGLGQGPAVIDLAER